ncbi:glycoside hydrolase family 2 protein [Schizophyllum commune H4-8]|uniref:glycoside hydrolase family 2 protein n=1 Tax=Schizophyllum commune (strain H4-8 / FGSC 9210) TaxID=578458 RepID=UPI00216033AA|nr:glycoside hydrolase family 2 protein [Schizophyllum commune H4-8]KAI5889009.1 glycoside hydrolase family 2 protein [Schizophyllum commune H4-8]
MFSPSFALWLCLAASSAVKAAIFDLSELQWTLRSANGSVEVPGAVPSHAHLDLLRAGIITEPNLGINDYTERWVFYDNWTYTASLAPLLSSSEVQAADRALLVFYGIDTVANVSIGDSPVAWVNNQFVQWVFDVTDIVQAYTGTTDAYGAQVPLARAAPNITVSLESAYWYGVNVTSRADARQYPDDNGTFEVPGYRHYVRKIQSDYGWDWGPAFVPSGIHKPAYLVTLSSSAASRIEVTTPPISPSGSQSTPDAIFIEESSIDIYKLGQNFSTAPVEDADWVVNVSLAIRSAAAFEGVNLTLRLPELGYESEVFGVGIEARTDAPTWVSVQWRVPDDVPERWWPFNLGEPKLYNLTVALDLSDAASVTFTTRTGFRTVQLVQTAYSDEEVAEKGLTPGDQWHFEVNGVAFYASGNNLIPLDAFYPRIRTEGMRWLLESAKLTGQSMLRVWGGGTYQPSSSSVAGGVYDFYALCDELGILAWSEFIFSDALYPVNPWFLDTIEPEIRQNVRRVNRHPSNVQWAGGNENEGIALYYKVWVEGGEVLFGEYVKLVQDFLYRVTTEETRSVPYTDCSTTKGVLSLDPYELRFDNGEEGYIYGNGERYNYDATQAFNYSTFPLSRFVNEFGWHAMPSIYSWEEVLVSPDDFEFNSTVVVSRDHHPPARLLDFPNPNAPQGQYEMTAPVELWLPTPSTPDPKHNFTQWCWSTQIFQAMEISAQVAFYRRGAGRPERNLGALVWQLNDVWQGISWAAVEYSGRWKPLQYALGSVFEKVAVYAFWDAVAERLEVDVVSDRLEGVRGVAQLTWYDWAGEMLKSEVVEFGVPALNYTTVLEGEGLADILPAGTAQEDVWLLVNSTALVDGEIVTSENYFTPTSLANANLVDPEVQLTHEGDLVFKLSAKGGVAPWTWLEHPAGSIGYFADNATGRPSNGFYLVPEIDRTLRFVLNADLSHDSQPSADDFVVRSLWNNTHQ